MDSDTQQYLPPKVAAQIIGVAVITLQKWRQKGQGPRFIRRIRRIYYPSRDLQDWYKNGD